ncbi:hypothetical protein F2Q70_00024341 [Brassica cretica]|uniref:Uncharacterized protein n=1 Tax=Brassica cretica TaxID=69181 RepID=A0A8S9LAS3_BRACR|nr:hypothetical protein F2Q70_00024341 [Brassica cretica]
MTCLRGDETQSASPSADAMIRKDCLEGNPVAGTMKKFSRLKSHCLSLHCSVTGSLSTCLLFAIKRPDVRKLLNLPDVVISSSTGQPSPPSPMQFSIPQSKDQSVGHEEPRMSSSESSSSVPDRRISRSSVLNQRIRTLERQLKDRKKK